MGVLRTALSAHGLTLSLQEISEMLYPTTGGGTGAHYEGVTVLDLSLDTRKAFHLPGGTLNVSVLQIHGSPIDAAAFEDLQPASGIAAQPTTRLWELWYQETLSSGLADVRIGQQSLDQEFIVSQYSGSFVNSMMGWPMLPSVDLYAGGPAFPMSSLGVRLRVQVAPAWTLLGGVFDDNPPGGPFGDDSQIRGAEASGMRFNMGTGALWMIELQHAAHASPAADCDTCNCSLPGTYKIGAWYDTSGFADQRIDNAGLSLTWPASGGLPRTDRGNHSVYAVVDQMIWRQPHGRRSMGVFARLMGAPADRNRIDFSLSAGMVVDAPLAGRGGVIGLGFGWSHISDGARDLERATERSSRGIASVRSPERFIELTYQYPLAPWWQLQPDLQYLDSSVGGFHDPQGSARWLGREWVFGLRTTITL